MHIILNEVMFLIHCESDYRASYFCLRCKNCQYGQYFFHSSSAGYFNLIIDLCFQQNNVPSASERSSAGLQRVLGAMTPSSRSSSLPGGATLTPGGYKVQVRSVRDRVSKLTTAHCLVSLVTAMFDFLTVRDNTPIRSVLCSTRSRKVYVNWGHQFSFKSVLFTLQELFV